MRKLDTKTRALIIRLLVEGNSIRAISRIAGASKNTVNKLLIDAGKACAKYHDQNVRNIKASVIQFNEVWSFTYAKKKNVKTATAAPEFAGDTWTWTAIDSGSKLIVSFMVGGRDSEYAIEFLDDLRDRLANWAQLTTDGHKTYLETGEGTSGGDVDYGQLINIYGDIGGKITARKYFAAEYAEIKKRTIKVNPHKAFVSTSRVERQYLTTRHTNGFCKKVENHMHAVALHFIYYNFVKVHQALRVTPAMAADLTDRLWDIADLVALVDANEPAQRKRGPYDKHQPENSK